MVPVKSAVFQKEILLHVKRGMESGALSRWGTGSSHCS